MKLRLSLPLILASVGATLFTVGIVVPCPLASERSRGSGSSGGGTADAGSEKSPALAKAEITGR